MTDIQKRFRELFKYNPIKGKLNESFDDVDTTGWICVGEVPYSPWSSSEDQEIVYIMVNPQKTMIYGKEVNEVMYTENNDGSGMQISDIPSFYKQYITIYPEYQNSEYGEMFLGKKKDDRIAKQQHEAFISKLFRTNGKVILHHNSSYKITDGFIKKGKPNNYSNNSDVGIYFWGSRNSGSDPSSSSLYTYYCIINEDDLYDFETNIERLTLEQALKKYKYVGQYWKNGDSVCVNTYEFTPIWCILDTNTGQWYDKDWKEIKRPFK